MDDIVITCLSHKIINDLKVLLHSQFKLKDLGHLKYFLGVELARSSKGIILSQRHYALELHEGIGFFSIQTNFSSYGS